MILVDGGFLLHRLLAIPHFSGRKNSRGDVIGGVEGALQSMYRMVSSRGYLESVAVAWDNGVPAFRRELSHEYKASRTNLNGPKTPYQRCLEILHEQVLPLLGCMSVRLPDCEADDLIAVMIRECGSWDGMPTTIYSSDQDYVQLLREDEVEIAQDTELKEILTEEAFVAERRLHPVLWRVQWKIYRALCGDASDGIAGVRRLGDVGAWKYAGRIIDGVSHGRTIQETLEMLEEDGPLSSPASREVLFRNLAVMDLDYGFATKDPLYAAATKAVRDSTKAVSDRQAMETEFRELELDDGLFAMADGIVAACGVLNRQRRAG